MSIFWLSSTVILAAAILSLAFLLLGTLRSLGLLSWRLEQLEATTPKRLGRDGLKPGKKAPDFSLSSADGIDVALHDFAGRKVLLVFTQSGCGPCRTVVPELNRLAAVGRIANPSHPQVVVVNNGDPEVTRKWSAAVEARFPVLAQSQFGISKLYEVFATPFAFLIDEKGVITSKGIINNRQHIRYVLTGVRPSEPGALATGDGEVSKGDADDEASEPENAALQESLTIPSSKEVSHV
jgi:methylamine dehydrogenase accessory protein MauD